MTHLAVRVEGLGKQYRIGEKQESYRTLRDALTDMAVAPFRRARAALQRSGGRRAEAESVIWALKDICLEINHGEVVGIIGRNGAGKSTFLKILSRITEPTIGFAEIHGRVNSLLEVGTGFHAELTGRENIYLNGAILGMKQAEIKRKFDEIVAFAEVEKFIDTPVKHYSSGMYLRLAFAVAAHLEPEILIVDEVLAVGDASFQKKCLNKMEDAGHQGRTVLFVSHNLPAVTRLCSRTVMLDQGTVVQDGPSPRVVSAYLSSGLAMTATREWFELTQAPHNDIVWLRAVRVRTEAGKLTDVVDIRQPVGIEVEYEVLQPGHKLVVNLGLLNEEGVYAFVVSDHHEPTWRRQPRPKGRFTSTVWIPGNLLSAGKFIVDIGIVTESPFAVHCQDKHAVAFEVADSFEGDAARGDYSGGWQGAVRPLLPWTTRFTPTEALPHSSLSYG